MKFRIATAPVIEETEVVVTAKIFGVGDFDPIKLDQSKVGGAAIKSWTYGANKTEFIFKLPLHPAKHWKAGQILVLDLKQTR